MKIEHTLKPIYNSKSQTLILGTMPSITSRREGKYYAHKQNRFWPIMENLYDEKIDDWKGFILKHHLALWDVISSCEINSSQDSSIKQVIPNDIESLINTTQITRIFLLGKKAYELYLKFFGNLPIEAFVLPSPSSANAKYKLADLVKEYSIIKNN